MEEELLRYKTLYEIATEENEVLKAQFNEQKIFYENQIKELKEQKQTQEKRQNVVYRGLRRIYKKLTKR